MLGLRKVKETEYQLSRALRIWHARGIDVKEGHPDMTAKWTSVREEKQGWTGWIQTRELIATAGIATGDLALSPEVEALIIEWMNRTGSLPSLNVDELAGSPLIFGDRPELCPDGTVLMAAVQTPLYTLWLDHLNINMMPPRGNMAGVGLKWRIDYVLGRSSVRAETLDAIDIHDLLVIRDLTSYASCFNKKIFSWSSPEEMMTSIHDEFNDIAEYDEDDTLLMAGENLTDLKKLPVKVEFILHSEMLTLEDLEKISAGQMHSFPESVEKQIEVRANGMRLGEGELVDYDGRLAVEIIRWMGGSDVE